MDPALTQPVHRAMLLRVMDRSNACVLLRNSQSVVHIELSPPLSPRSHVNAKGINALSPVPATVRLGPYSTAQHRFTACSMEAQLPEPNYSRVAYTRRA